MNKEDLYGFCEFIKEQNPIVRRAMLLASADAYLEKISPKTVVTGNVPGKTAIETQQQPQMANKVDENNYSFETGV